MSYDPTSTEGVPEHGRERLAQMKAAGWSLEQMADEFGCDPSTVSLRLLRHGLR